MDWIALQFKRSRRNASSPSRLTRNEEEINCDVSCELLRAVRWRLVCSGNEAPLYGRCGLLARNDSVSAMPRAPSRAAAIKCRSAHKYKSYRIVLLLVDAPGGRDPGKQLSAQRLALTMPPNLVSRTLLVRTAADRLFELETCPAGLKRPVFLVVLLSYSRTAPERHFGKRHFLSGIPAELAREDTNTLKARLILGINARYTLSSDSNKNLMFQEFISWSIHIPETSESSMKFLNSCNKV